MKSCELPKAELLRIEDFFPYFSKFPGQIRIYTKIFKVSKSTMQRLFDGEYMERKAGCHALRKSLRGEGVDPDSIDSFLNYLLGTLFPLEVKNNLPLMSLLGLTYAPVMIDEVESILYCVAMCDSWTRSLDNGSELIRDIQTDPSPFFKSLLCDNAIVAWFEGVERELKEAYPNLTLTKHLISAFEVDDMGYESVKDRLKRYRDPGQCSIYSSKLLVDMWALSLRLKGEKQQMMFASAIVVVKIAAQLHADPSLRNKLILESKNYADYVKRAPTYLAPLKEKLIHKNNPIKSSIK
jgi:hypothetical protein